MSLGHRSRARKTFYQASWDLDAPEGREFDSMLEASVARDLDILYKTKKIKAVRAQVWFDLYGKNGTRVCRHRPDFLVTLLNDTQKIIEAKGEEAADWKIKRELFKDNYPHIEYITATRENMNYGKVIDVPHSKPPSPSTYQEDVQAVMRHLNSK